MKLHTNPSIGNEVVADWLTPGLCAHLLLAGCL